MSKRIKIHEVFPESYQVLLQLSKLLADAGIDKLQQELIKIRASQINGCAFCMNLHINDAIKYGEDPKRLYVLSAWRESKKWFSKEDQVILKMTEEITEIAVNGVSDQTYEEAITLFGEKMTATIIMSIININALNRIGITTSLHPF